MTSAYTLVAMLALILTSKDDYQRFAVHRSALCVRAGLSVKSYPAGGWLGGDARELRVTYAGGLGTKSVGAPSVLQIYVRPTDESAPNPPRFDETRAMPIEGIDGLVETTRDESPYRVKKIVGPSTSAILGRFIAECRDLRYRADDECSRSFNYQGLAGVYYFSGTDLASWKEMELVLERALVSKDIVRCSR
ncbi:MAG: hypothetical protein J0I77_18065 [Rudaea sp.]|uniref:hypothetical protein n=1 Tax=unclassified Rudaea TaxID=2627037 RepID=UPI0010F4384B|nr:MULTISPECIES: hypothetical protein [unclassified Rudaea]MBN8887636.1 hypothetical protein [Rudaea sp.]